MPTSTPPSELFNNRKRKQLKRAAKALSTGQRGSYTRNLVELAKNEGFSNLTAMARATSAKRSAKNDAPAEGQHSGGRVSATRTVDTSRPWCQFTRTPEEWKAARRSRAGYRDELKSKPQDLSHEFSSAANAVQYAIDYLEFALSLPRFAMGPSSLAEEEMRVYFPKLIQPDGEPGTYQLCNREWQPLGRALKGGGHFDTTRHLQFRLTPQQLAEFERNGDHYLYTSDEYPWQTRGKAAPYLDRLRRLLVVLQAAEASNM